MGNDSVVDVALDTVNLNKQALVFVNAKRSAERVAEDISKKLKPFEKAKELAEKVLSVLSKPTKQCERLAKCVCNGIAFHHSGLASKQRELIEVGFRNGTIKIICCTPTLAAGVDLPAFRAIIRDVKRYTKFGMTNIPVLEFMQMCGRAGRPKFDKFGEVIVIADTESEMNFIVDHYFNGGPEEIFSKLAVEPVLRKYLLSLISSRIISSRKSILDFFKKTFWAFQFEDFYKLEEILDDVLLMLVKWGFLEIKDDSYNATLLGRRVSELYLDPFTAHVFITALKKASEITVKSFSFLHLVCNSLEMRPLLRVKQKEFDEVLEKSALQHPFLLVPEPNMFDPEFDSWLNAFKTSLMLFDWIEEKDDEFILEKYDCRPGETRSKIEIANWLLFACYELARINKQQSLLKDIMKTRLRVKYGVKDELLPLVRLQGIGRARARKLFRHSIKDIKDLKKEPVEKLALILGVKLAESVKKQLE